MKKPLERSIQASVLRRLGALKAADGTLAFRQRHGSPMTTAGDPDIHGLWRGVAFEIELKQPGEKATALQQVRLEEWARAGAVTAVIHNTQELEEVLERVRTLWPR